MSAEGRNLRSAGVIQTLAGNPCLGESGDGGPASEALFNRPFRVAVDVNNTTFVSDYFNASIRVVLPSGYIQRFAGTGVSGYGGDGGPSARALINGPVGIAIGPDRSVYIADSLNDRVRRVDSSGRIDTFPVSSGPPEGRGDQPTAGAFQSPMGVAVGSAGVVYVADTDHYRVCRIQPDAAVEIVCGTGVCGFSGDGGPATSAALHRPFAVALGPDESVFIADAGNNRIRRLLPDGTVETFAGSGARGFSGDGGPADVANLALPCDVAVGKDGVVYIADYLNDRVRVVLPDRTVHTVAGCGVGGYGGDGGQATEARLTHPRGVAVTPGGDLVIADTENACLRLVSQPLYRWMGG